MSKQQLDVQHSIELYAENLGKEIEEILSNLSLNMLKKDITIQIVYQKENDEIFYSLDKEEDARLKYFRNCYKTNDLNYFIEKCKEEGLEVVTKHGAILHKCFITFKPQHKVIKLVKNKIYSCLYREVLELFKQKDFEKNEITIKLFYKELGGEVFYNYDKENSRGKTFRRFYNHKALEYILPILEQNGFIVKKSPTDLYVTFVTSE